MINVPGLTAEKVEQLRERMRQPEGTIQLPGTWPGLHDPSMPNGIIAELTSGGHAFRIARTAASHVRAHHSTPGSGTHVADLDITPFSPAERVDVWLAWSPDVLRLMIANPTSGQILSADGHPSPMELWVDARGGVVEVGDSGVDIKGLRVSSSRNTLVSPPANALWEDVKTAVASLLSGKSDDGYMFEVVCSNAALGMVVTGFETYCEKRFVEVESEGVPPDAPAFVSRFGTAEERAKLKEGFLPTSIADAIATSTPIAPLMARRVNFQNYEDCKRAFNKAYGVRFGIDLGVASQPLEHVQRMLSFRHRIVHVSPMLGFLNQNEVPPEEPVFARRELVAEALAAFDEVIQALHQATLRLRPAQGGS